MLAYARHAQGRSTKGKGFLRPHLEDMIYERGAEAQKAKNSEDHTWKT
jgi:hypothetical protein